MRAYDPVRLVVSDVGPSRQKQRSGGCLRPGEPVTIAAFDHRRILCVVVLLLSAANTVGQLLWGQPHKAWAHRLLLADSLRLPERWLVWGSQQSCANSGDLPHCRVVTHCSWTLNIRTGRTARDWVDCWLLDATCEVAAAPFLRLRCCGSDEPGVRLDATKSRKPRCCSTADWRERDRAALSKPVPCCRPTDQIQRKSF